MGLTVIKKIIPLMNASMRTYSQVGPIDGGVFKGERKTEMMKR